jgi:DNA-binding protein HU-beta
MEPLAAWPSVLTSTEPLEFKSSPRQNRRRTLGKDSILSKAFLAAVLHESTGVTGVAANQAAADLIGAIVKELKSSGGFTLPSFGTFRVAKTKARKALNPRTGELGK